MKNICNESELKLHDKCNGSVRMQDTCNVRERTDECNNNEFGKCRNSSMNESQTETDAISGNKNSVINEKINNMYRLTGSIKTSGAGSTIKNDALT